MKNLEKEAIEFAIETGYERESYVEAFIAGANSKWVQSEVLKTKIDCWEKALKIIPREDEDRILLRLEDLKQQLKELEDESNT